MKIDATLLLVFLLVLVRCSAILVAWPIFGPTVPLRIRASIGIIVSAALVPVLQPYLLPVPQDLYELLMRVLHEVAVGLLIGTIVQFLLLTAQIAGAMMDLQMGLGNAQLLNPSTGTPVSILTQFQYMLILVLFLILNGHHQVFQAFVKSYELGTVLTEAGLPRLELGFVQYITKITLLAIQIAAPVVGICLLVDISAGVINKSVPQMQVFFVAMPAKIIAGMLALAFGLPVLVVAIQNGLENTWHTLFNLLTDGKGSH